MSSPDSMDLEAYLTQLQQQHSEQKTSLQSQLETTIREINETTAKHVEQDPRGKALYERKQQLYNQLRQRKQQLFNQYQGRRQQLDNQFRADRDSLDQELLHVGRRLGEADPQIRTLITDRKRIEHDLNTLDQRRLDEVFNLIPKGKPEIKEERDSSLSVHDTLSTQEKVVASGSGDVAERAVTTTPCPPPVQPGSQRFSVTPPNGKISEDPQEDARHSPAATEHRAQKNPDSPTPSQLPTVKQFRSGDSSLPVRGVFRQFAKQITPQTYAPKPPHIPKDSVKENVEIRSEEDKITVGASNPIDALDTASAKNITQEQFDEIRKTYPHACLKDGTVYLRACKRCGSNATQGLKSDPTSSRFLRGDGGFLSHLAITHNEKLSKDNVHEYCTEGEVDYNDAVLMSKGDTPKGTIMIRNATMSIPYEEFRSKGKPGPAPADETAEADKTTTTKFQKPAPSDFFTMSGRIKESGKRTALKRQGQSQLGEHEDVNEASSKKAERSQDVIMIDSSDDAVTSDTSEDVPMPKRRRLTRRSQGF